MTRCVLFLLASLLLGCWASEVDRAARATVLIDEQVAVWVTECMDDATGWEEWDECAAVGGHVGRLRETALSLDVAKGRTGKKTAACEWFRALDPLPAVPAVVVARQSKWKRKC